MDARPASSNLIGSVLSGRYRLEAKIGSGGMSTVYLARDETLDRQVAVKLMHREMSEQPEQFERFNMEARAVAKLSHPNVVTVIDAGEDEGRPYIVFEYVEGETLKQRISRVGALDVQEAIAYSIEIARGLSVAHERNLVHRDVKPQNILIDRTGRAKLTDFGISRQLEQDGMTATGRVLGTTDYVAPEQAMGHRVDPRSDVYSLGVVLYEMLTGDVPFEAESQVGVAMKHVNELLPDVQIRRPEVSATVALVVERATSKEPGERYQSVGEMIDDLQTALEVEASRAGSTTGEATSILDAVPPAKRKLSRRTGVSVAAVLAIIAVAAAALGLVQLISSGNAPGGKGGSRPAGEEIEITSATDYDPVGGDDEHSSETPNAVDSNSSITGGAWTTETYEQNFPASKPGVGIYVGTAAPAAAKTIEIRSTAPGMNVEVYGAAEVPTGDDAADPLAGWTKLGEQGDVKTTQSIALDQGIPGAEFSYYLVWITSLADYPDGFRAEITDVRLLG